MNQCRNVVDISIFIKSCYVDYCNNPTDDTINEIYKAFFDACRKIKGPNGAVCDWKTKLGSDSCPGEQGSAFLF